MKNFTILFMRTSVSVYASLFIGSIIILLGAESLFPGLLYSDAEAASVTESSDTLPLPLITGVSAAAEPTGLVSEARATPPPTVQATPPIQPITPTHLSIPAVSIDSPVIGVGTNAQGEMDVPDGKTNNVGWYKQGVKPGETGTAVFDAHVYAAFKKLSRVSVGDDIYLTAGDGTTLHYRVTRVATYALASLSSSTLFAPSNTRDINLITCAGTYVASSGTYDHRTIVSATLAL